MGRKKSKHISLGTVGLGIEAESLLVAEYQRKNMEAADYRHTVIGQCMRPETNAICPWMADMSRASSPEL